MRVVRVALRLVFFFPSQPLEKVKCTQKKTEDQESKQMQPTAQEKQAKKDAGMKNQSISWWHLPCGNCAKFPEFSKSYQHIEYLARISWREVQTPVRGRAGMTRRDWRDEADCCFGIMNGTTAPNKRRTVDAQQTARLSLHASATVAIPVTSDTLRTSLCT